jgi:hypothetical protein
MALAASKVRVFGTGELSVAPVGTTLPTTVSGALDPAFVGLGYNSEDGITISRDVSIEDILAWQSVTPVRRVASETTFSLAGSFLQSDPTVVALFLGLGAFTGTTDFTAVGSTVQGVTERAVVLDFKDGTIDYRLVIQRAEVTSDGEINVTRTDAAAYPLTFTALAPSSGTDLYSLITDDVAFDPTP